MTATAAEIAAELRRLETAPPAQVGRADVATMTRSEILAARESGALDDLLAGRRDAVYGEPARDVTPAATPDADQGARGSSEDALDRVARMSGSAIVAALDSDPGFVDELVEARRRREAGAGR